MCANSALALLNGASNFTRDWTRQKADGLARMQCDNSLILRVLSMSSAGCPAPPWGVPHSTKPLPSDYNIAILLARPHTAI